MQKTFLWKHIYLLSFAKNSNLVTIFSDLLQTVPRPVSHCFVNVFWIDDVVVQCYALRLL